MALRIGTVVLISHAAEGVVYAADNGADVISMSWGAGQFQVVKDAIFYAHGKGVALFASAGNSGKGSCNEPPCETMIYPAIYPSVIAVGATNSNDFITTWSSVGTALDICAPGDEILSLRADACDLYGSTEPGVHIIDTNYYLCSGTSMSSPMAAAVGAYMIAVSPGLVADKVQEILQATAKDLVDPYGEGDSYPGYDAYSGYGRISLYDALNAVPKLRARITMPLPNQVLYGNITVSGIADGDDFESYTLEYGSGSNPTAWTEIASSSVSVTDGVLAMWNTSGLNGYYTLRLRLGESNISRVTFFVAHAVSASISNPLQNDTIPAFVDVKGSAYCPDFSRHVVEYREVASPGSWSEIVTDGRPVIDGNLASWNVGTLNDGSYFLRLSVFSQTKLEASDSIQVYIQSLFSSGQAWRVTVPGVYIDPNPNYGDFDNDGTNEIIVGSKQGIKFFTPDGLPKTAGLPVIPNYDFRIPIPVGNLDGDGIDDFVAVGVYRTEADTTGRLFGYSSSNGSFEILLTEVPGISMQGEIKQLPSVFLKDIDDDGKDEIHYFSGWYYMKQASYYIYESDGSFRIKTPDDAAGKQNYYAFQPADLDGDGVDEFYMADTLLIMSDINGNIIDSFVLNVEYPDFRTWGMSADDIDSDGKLELIVSGMYGEPLGTGDLNTYWTYAFGENLSPESGWPHNSGISFFSTVSHPIFGDINGDNDLEYFMGGNDFGWGVFIWLAFRWFFDYRRFL